MRSALTDLHPVYRRLIAMALEDVRAIDTQIDALDQEMAHLLGPHQRPCSDWRRCRAWVSIPPSRSSPRSAPPPRRFPHPSTSPRGSGRVPATRRVPA